jgi:hypothetical protein
VLVLRSGGKLAVDVVDVALSGSSSSSSMMGSSLVSCSGSSSSSLSSSRDDVGLACWLGLLPVDDDSLELLFPEPPFDAGGSGYVHSLLPFLHPEMFCQ